MEFEVKVPVKPHLKKFLIKIYGGDAIRVNKKDMMGVILMSLLEKNHDPHSKYINRPVDTVTFMIGEFYSKRSGFFLSNYNVALINNFLDSIFRYMFYDSVAKKLQGSEPDKGFYKGEARAFLQYYDISEDDFSLASFLKDFYRARKEDKNLGANCPLKIGRFQLYSREK